MEWLESHDLALYGEVLVFEPFKYPKRSKERSEIWGRIAVNLNSPRSQKFTVSKRSLDAALEEIAEKERAADLERKDKTSAVNKKNKSEKTSAEEVRLQAMERLSKTQKRNADLGEEKSSKYRKRSSDAVEYLKEKFQEEKELRKEEIELKRKEQQMMLDQRFKHTNSSWK
ncbi:DDRGK domain-containing protein 1-like [Pocillopora damicornis]|uniref:DDRGK domain-containing protein 1-like n=1 Tax=Pocillopora damicornis TaxID=46731 RepID=UPI000F55788D|nr:DDRGK domain-containing protein 1-like [Pocillopora damicornis]